MEVILILLAQLRLLVAMTDLKGLANIVQPWLGSAQLHGLVETGQNLVAQAEFFWEMKLLSFSHSIK